MPRHESDDCFISGDSLKNITEMVDSSNAELQRLDDLLKTRLIKKHYVKDGQKLVLSKRFWFQNKSELASIQERLRDSRQSITLALVGVNTVGQQVPFPSTGV